MGNDGGSIPDRRDLVRSKRKPEAPDRANQTRARWHFCALSKKALRQPVVADKLGKLYRKDAMLEFLLDRGAFGDGEEICGYVRGMKDFKTLTLTPVASANADDDADEDKAKFLCPLTQKEMTGHVPFVYLSTCGCVFSAAGLKAVTSSSSSSSSSTTPSPPAEDKAEVTQKDVCPNCATKFDARTDVRTINPGPEEEERLRAEMLAERAAAKGKKRKAAAAGADASADGVKVKKAKAAGAATTDEVEGGKRKTAEGRGRKRDGGDGNMGVPRSVAASLAEEEAKRKAGMSDAVKSLYRDKNGPGRKETFMTMGTFTRYA